MSRLGQLVIGQEAVGEKSNEIIAIPLLLERLELTGALVTIDATGTQRDIADIIVKRGGDYLLALKGCRPLTHADTVLCFANPPLDTLETASTTTDGEHDRIEGRRHLVRHDFNWLFSDRRYAGEPKFPHLAVIGIVDACGLRNGKTMSERPLSALSQTRRQILRRRHARH